MDPGKVTHSDNYLLFDKDTQSISWIQDNLFRKHSEKTGLPYVAEWN